MKAVKLITLLIGFGLICSSSLRAQSGEISSTTSNKHNISWYSLEHAQKLAKKTGKKVLVYAEASWCTYCKRMESEVFPQSDVQETMKKYYYPVRIDIESGKQLTFNGKKMTQQQFSRKMRVSGTPTFFFIDREGSVIGAQPGFIPKDVYTSLLTYVGTDTYEKMKFKEYLNQ